MTIHMPLGYAGRQRVAAAAVGDLRLAGALFAVVGAAFLAVTMLAASIAPAYDFAGGAISDLGVIPETALLFNLLLVGIGVLNAVGGALLYRARRRPWLLVLFLVAGLGAAGAGLFPLDRGGLHSIFALAAFVFFNLQAIGTARLFGGVMRAAGVLAGAVGLVYVVVMVIGDAGNPAVFGPIGHGGAERMIAYPAMLWMLLLGGHLLGAERPVSHQATHQPVPAG